MKMKICQGITALNLNLRSCTPAIAPNSGQIFMQLILYLCPTAHLYIHWQFLRQVSRTLVHLHRDPVDSDWHQYEQ